MPITKSYDHWNQARALVRKAVRDVLTNNILQAEEAAARIVPIDTANLSNAIDWRLFNTKEGASVIFGVLSNVAYAYLQHEDLNFGHAAGRSAKFIEKPLRNQLPTIRQDLAKALRRVTRMLPRSPL